MLVVACGLTACAEEKKPIEVPSEVRDGVTALLRVADPAVEPTFTGETCNTDPLADPPDDHRWRMTADVDATDEALRGAATGLGWQPERAADGTLLLANEHQFGARLKLVVLDGRVTMLVEKDCTGTELTDRDHAGGGEAELTARQGDRLEDTVDDIQDTLAAIHRELKVRPKQGEYVADPGQGSYESCDAGDRSGANWVIWDAVVAEVTSDTDLAPPPTGWSTRRRAGGSTERAEETDDRGYRDVTLGLASSDGRATLDIRLNFWGTLEAPGTVRLHVSQGKDHMCGRRRRVDTGP